MLGTLIEHVYVTFAEHSRSICRKFAKRLQNMRDVTCGPLCRRCKYSMADVQYLYNISLQYLRVSILVPKYQQNYAIMSSGHI
jgi:hypothetical protein